MANSVLGLTGKAFSPAPRNADKERSEDPSISSVALALIEKKSTPPSSPGTLAQRKKIAKRESKEIKHKLFSSSPSILALSRHSIYELSDCKENSPQPLNPLTILSSQEAQQLKRTSSLISLEEIQKLKRTSSLVSLEEKKQLKRTSSSSSLEDVQYEKQNRLGKYIPFTLECPALTKEEWERAALHKLEEFAGLKKTYASELVIKDFVRVSLKTTTIFLRMLEALKNEDYPFLAPFLEIQSPEIFLSSYKILSKIERRILREIIGGKPVYSQIKLCLIKKTHKSWSAHLAQAHRLTLACAACENLEAIYFPPSFDANYPISSIKFNDIRDSFRFFFGSKTDLSQVYFHLNKAPLAPPKIDENTDEASEIQFMTWLISNLNGALDAASSLSPREQAELVCCGVMQAEERNALKNKLFDFLKKYGRADPATILSQLKKNAFSEAFRWWALKKMDEISNENSAQDATEHAADIVKAFARDFDLSVLNREVPCYPILQSLSFSAYNKVPVYLRKKLFPKLFSSVWDQLQMKTFATDPTRYAIAITPDAGTFEATQVKLYRFSKADILLGSVELHWTLCGKLEDPSRTAQLRLRNLQFDSKKSIASRLEIVEMLGL